MLNMHCSSMMGPHLRKSRSHLQGTAERRATYILRTRSSAARATREVAGWWAMQATALPTATSPCNLCCLKSHMHNRPSSPVVTSTLLHASAAMPVTLLSCAAARRLVSPTLQQQSLSLLSLSLQAASSCRPAVDRMLAVTYLITASIARWQLHIQPYITNWKLCLTLRMTFANYP